MCGTQVVAAGGIYLFTAPVRGLYTFELCNQSEFAMYGNYQRSFGFIVQDINISVCHVSVLLEAGSYYVLPSVTAPIQVAVLCPGMPLQFYVTDSPRILTIEGAVFDETYVEYPLSWQCFGGCIDGISYEVQSRVRFGNASLWTSEYIIGDADSINRTLRVSGGEETSLRIQTIYSCPDVSLCRTAFVGNLEGSVIASIQVPPLMPFTVQASEVEAPRIYGLNPTLCYDLSWETADSLITHFQLTIIQLGIADINANTTSALPMFRACNVQFYKQVRVLVRACNAAGCSSTSTPYSFKSPAPLPANFTITLTPQGSNLRLIVTAQSAVSVGMYCCTVEDSNQHAVYDLCANVSTHKASTGHGIADFSGLQEQDYYIQCSARTTYEGKQYYRTSDVVPYAMPTAAPECLSVSATTSTGNPLAQGIGIAGHSRLIFTFTKALNVTQATVIPKTQLQTLVKFSPYVLNVLNNVDYTGVVVANILTVTFSPANPETVPWAFLDGITMDGTYLLIGANRGASQLVLSECPPIDTAQLSFPAGADMTASGVVDAMEAMDTVTAVPLSTVFVTAKARAQDAKVKAVWDTVACSIVKNMSGSTVPCTIAEMPYSPSQTEYAFAVPLPLGFHGHLSVCFQYQFHNGNNFVTADSVCTVVAVQSVNLPPQVIGMEATNVVAADGVAHLLSVTILSSLFDIVDPDGDDITVTLKQFTGDNAFFSFVCDTTTPLHPSAVCSLPFNAKSRELKVSGPAAHVVALLRTCVAWQTRTPGTHAFLMGVRDVVDSNVSTDVLFTVNASCNTQTSIAMTSATVEGSVLTVAFDGRVHYSASVLTGCVGIFDAASVSKFGHNAVCSVTGNAHSTTLVVKLGSMPALRAGDSITIKPQSHLTTCAGLVVDTSSVRVVIQSKSVYPVISLLSSVQHIGVCDGLQMVLETDSVFEEAIQWSINAESSVDFLRFVQHNGRKMTIDEFSLHEISRLFNLTAIDVTVAVRNIHGFSSTVNRTVAIVNEEFPYVTESLSGTTMSAQCSDKYARVSVEFECCGSSGLSCTLAEQNAKGSLRFEWQVLHDDISIHGSWNEHNTGDLQIPIAELEAATAGLYRSYDVFVTVQYSNGPGHVVNNYELVIGCLDEIYISEDLVHRDPTRDWSVALAWTSRFVNATPPTVKWDCVDQSTALPALFGSPLQLVEFAPSSTDTLSLFVPQNSLGEGVYTCTATAVTVDGAALTDSVVVYNLRDRIPMDLVVQSSGQVVTDTISASAHAFVARVAVPAEFREWVTDFKWTLSHPALRQGDFEATTLGDHSETLVVSELDTTEGFADGSPQFELTVSATFMLEGRTFYGSTATTIQVVAGVSGGQCRLWADATVDGTYNLQIHSSNWNGALSNSEYVFRVQTPSTGVTDLTMKPSTSPSLVVPSQYIPRDATAILCGIVVDGTTSIADSQSVFVSNGTATTTDTLANILATGLVRRRRAADDSPAVNYTRATSTAVQTANRTRSFSSLYQHLLSVVNAMTAGEIVHADVVDVYALVFRSLEEYVALHGAVSATALMNLLVTAYNRFLEDSSNNLAAATDSVLSTMTLRFNDLLAATIASGYLVDRSSTEHLVQLQCKLLHRFAARADVPATVADYWVPEYTSDTWALLGAFGASNDGPTTVGEVIMLGQYLNRTTDPLVSLLKMRANATGMKVVSRSAQSYTSASISLSGSTAESVLVGAVHVADTTKLFPQSIARSDNSRLLTTPMAIKILGDFDVDGFTVTAPMSTVHASSTASHACYHMSGSGWVRDESAVLTVGESEISCSYRLRGSRDQRTVAGVDQFVVIGSTWHASAPPDSTPADAPSAAPSVLPDVTVEDEADPVAEPTTLPILPIVGVASAIVAIGVLAALRRRSRRHAKAMVHVVNPVRSTYMPGRVSHGDMSPFTSDIMPNDSACSLSRRPSQMIDTDLLDSLGGGKSSPEAWKAAGFSEITGMPQSTPRRDSDSVDLKSRKSLTSLRSSHSILVLQSAGDNGDATSIGSTGADSVRSNAVLLESTEQPSVDAIKTNQSVTGKLLRQNRKVKAEKKPPAMSKMKLAKAIDAVVQRAMSSEPDIAVHGASAGILNEGRAICLPNDPFSPTGFAIGSTRPPHRSMRKLPSVPKNLPAKQALPKSTMQQNRRKSKVMVLNMESAQGTKDNGTKARAKNTTPAVVARKPVKKPDVPKAVRTPRRLSTPVRVFPTSQKD